MQNVSIANFSQNILAALENIIKHNEPLNVNTAAGSVVIMSDEEYRGMQETLYLLSVPGMREKLLEGKAEALSDCVPEEEVAGAAYIIN